jgi:hypothetical protein
VQSHDGEYMELSFRGYTQIRGLTQRFLVILWYRHRRICVRLIKDPEDYLSVLCPADFISIVSDLGQANDKRELTGDYLSMRLDDNTIVSVSAKKTRAKSVLWWKLMVDIKDGDQPPHDYSATIVDLHSYVVNFPLSLYSKP